MDLYIERGTKLAFVGQNGQGKSTLAKLLVSVIKGSGNLRLGHNVKIGYFAQNHGDDFKSDTTLMDWMAKYSHKEDDLETIRGTLGRLLFSQDDINKPVSVLSGGEQRRMLFGKIILQRANVIILDEPTNHLDMESIEALNHALDIFEGTVIFVSHDREFISSLSTRLIEVKKER